RLEPAPLPAADDGRPVVLVVEDDPELARILARLLASEGYGSSRAGTVADAEAACHQKAPSAILLDLVLPDGNGLELMERLQRSPATRDIPVIVATGHGGKGGFASPALVDWLEKPPDQRRL